MSSYYVTGANPLVQELARFVGLEKLDGVRALHIHCEAGEVVTVDVERYAMCEPDFTFTTTTRYQLVEIEEAPPAP